MSGTRRIAPQLPVTWRGEDEVQIGTSAAVGVRLAGLAPGDRRTLALLARGTSLAALDTDARRSGADPQRGRDLVAALAARRMLVPAEAGAQAPEALRLRAERWTWSLDQSGERASAVHRRPSLSVLVSGATPVAVPVASGFAASGVGAVQVVADEAVSPADVVPGGPALADVGRPLAAASAEALLRLSGGGSRSRRPDLVVCVGRDAHDATGAAAWLAEDLPHLAVLVRDTEIVVGPLVVPGRGPCLHCLDLHHRDRDRRWPEVLPQLLARAGPRPVATVPALVQVAAGVAVLLGLGHLDGAPEARPGAAATVRLPFGEVAWRVWPAHPACGCTALGDGDGAGDTMPR